MAPLKIKICGMRDAVNIEGAAALNPDYLGYIFVSQSKRFCGTAFVLGKVKLYPGIKNCAVFMDQAEDEVTAVLRTGKFQAVQLHGSETGAYCRRLKDRCKNIELIKSFGMDDNFSFDACADYENSCDVFLFDCRNGPVLGGGGTKFNWDRLKEYRGVKGYFLSGGIGPADAAKIKELKQRDSRLVGADLNSCFEDAPGIKNCAFLRKFMEELRL